MTTEPEQQHSKSTESFAPGDLYEDCAYHPCLCVGVVDNDDEEGIWGISLIDGSYPRKCSLYHCGVRKLTIDEAWEIKRATQKITREGF